MGGVDWRSVGWVEYQTGLEAWNIRHSDDADRPEPRPGGAERMRRAMQALKEAQPHGHC